MANLLDEICRENDQCRRSNSGSTCIDPELDEFMVSLYICMYLQASEFILMAYCSRFLWTQETYCEILAKYKDDLAKPFNEATSFFNSMETRLSDLCGGASRSYIAGLSISISLSFSSYLSLCLYYISIYLFQFCCGLISLLSFLTFVLLEKDMVLDALINFVLDRDCYSIA